jgi:electron transfer flavoprotein beta subunit
MRICVLVKEVPDAVNRARIDPQTRRLDRSGERGLNPYDAHAIEAAVQLRESGAPVVEEVVALTMGPPSAGRTLHRALSLGADRSLHVCDDDLAGSDAVATGLVLARALAREQPDLVLLGQQSSDGECFALGPIVAEHLRMPVLTQVARLGVVEGRRLVCERQTEYGYDTVELELPAVVSVTEALNEPRYPSLKAIMAAKARPARTIDLAELGIEPDRVGMAGARARLVAVTEPGRRTRGLMIENRDTDATVARIIAWLEERRLL